MLNHATNHTQTRCTSFNSLGNMIRLVRTNSQNPEFKRLVQLLNLDLAKRDGETHPLSEFNYISDLNNVVLALRKNKAIGCGAISEYDSNTMEIKRMYVSLETRGLELEEKFYPN